MSPQLIQLIVFGALILAGAFVYWRSNGKVTPQQLAQAAQMAVMAAEQYKNTGKLKTNDEQLRFAIDFVQRLLPAANAIPDELIIDAIHAFVPAANAVTAQIEATWGGAPKAGVISVTATGEHGITATASRPTPKPPTLGNMG